MPDSPRLCGRIFPICLGKFKHPRFTFLNQNTPSSLKIEQKTSKNYVLEISIYHSLNFAPLPQNSGQSLKFNYTPLSGLKFEVWLAKICF